MSLGTGGMGLAALKQGRHGARNLQPGMPAPQSPHGLGLHARHAQEILGVGEIGRELSQLRLKLGLVMDARVRNSGI